MTKEETPPPTTTDPKKLKAMEAKAVAEATATADAAYTPSPSLLNAPTAEALLRQVDGPSLTEYESKDSIYVAKSVPVSAGGKLAVPIQVTTPGSVVEYAIDNKYYDIGFGITAEREEGITIVKEMDRIDATKDSVSGKFLVGSVPCLIQFQFENDYSWMREKVISYKVTVTPPSRDTLQAGRRRRAKACHKAVKGDLSSSETKLVATVKEKASLESKIKLLRKELEETMQSMESATKEESTLQERLKLRKEQNNLLEHRLTKGWEDE